jgi:hypothetical protein
MSSPEHEQDKYIFLLLPLFPMSYKYLENSARTGKSPQKNFLPQRACTTEPMHILQELQNYSEVPVCDECATIFSHSSN